MIFSFLTSFGLISPASFVIFPLPVPNYTISPSNLVKTLIGVNVNKIIFHRGM